MVTQSELETWNSILWSECEAPDWLSHDSIEQATIAAQTSFPNEVCGLYVRIEEQIRLHVFQGMATSISCLADGNEVISFAYRLLEQSGSILASFHTHPDGSVLPSKHDALLNLWAHQHVLFVKNGTSWVYKVYQS